MSQIYTGFTEERQGDSQGPAGVNYIPTDEERRVFRECNQESFWYRSLPFSAVSMAITQALVVRGTLSSSPRFGSLPKVAFAGLCGYLAGKMSYMKTCQEKFQRLESSPLGEALRKKTQLPPLSPQGPRSEMSDPDAQSFESMFQPSDPQSQTPPQDKDYGYSAQSPDFMDQREDPRAPAQSYLGEEEPRRKSVLYEDLRNKNRENYEVTLTQKTETPSRPAPDRPSPQREAVQKNIYGDAWDE
ncbi:OCIA domain-containing protein 1-like isoform X1 [Osmerus mordax]|uniref:OCIA domain-containing protein 1-like isoform X1 n=1 Tax=Osmerus mordax TaxID=8014 RepID=UPI00350EAAA3